jgi:Fic family protein
VPAITIPRAARLLGVTHRAARLTVDKLIQAGVLVEVGERQRNKLFIALGIIRAVEGSPD